MKLYFRELVAKGQPLIILHGLFGSSDNWLTQAKLLARQYHVYMLDQRNHGQSPHSDEFDYTLLADDLHEFIITNAIDTPIVLGHSMGGKAAMKFALAHPELISKLIIVDIGPKAYALRHDRIMEGLKAIPVNSIQSRNEADVILSEYVPQPGVRQFLLKNLQRKPEGGFSWKLNLSALDNNQDNVGEGFDSSLGKFDKPALFVHGLKSEYIVEDDKDFIKSIFPKAQFVALDAGHWIHAEKPAEFVQEVTRFLQS